jgi:hypothetical protein
MTLRLRELLLGLRDLNLAKAPVIVHSSLSSFGKVEDGAETVVNALTGVFETLLVPTYTYKTMIVPGRSAGQCRTYDAADQNRMADFHPKMPADPLDGCHRRNAAQAPRARSLHPRSILCRHQR